MPRIWITRDITLDAEAYLTQRGFAVVRRETADRRCQPEELAGFDGVLSMGVHYPGDVLRANKQLKIIALASAGYDFVDVACAKALGIQVTNAPNANARSVAEHTAMLILACAKDLAYAARCKQTNDWDARLNHYTRDLAGATLGLIGCGSIGREVAQIMHDGLRMEVLAYRRSGRRATLPAYIRVTESLDELYACADVLSLHVPLTPETEGMIDRAALSKMKPSAILINCARGRVVCQHALTEALQSGTIAFAGLDVLECEPPDAADPLRTLPNVILTPHNAAITKRTTERVCRMAAQNIEAVFAGKPPLHAVY